MCDGVEVKVWIDGRQGCLVACVRTEPSTEKGVWTRQTQPDVAPEYRAHKTHRTQSPHYESQDATRPYPMQDGFLLMPLAERIPTHPALTLSDHWLKGYPYLCTLVPLPVLSCFLA